MRRWLLLLLLLAAVPGQAQTGPPRILMSGADSMLLLGQKWAGFYRTSTHSSVNIAVLQGNETSALAGLKSGSIQVAQLVRPLSHEEERGLQQQGLSPVTIPVGIETVVIFVHPGNPVSELSTPQLKAILTGRISNWKEVGGRDLPIQIYSTESAVGGSLFLRESLLEGEEFDTTMRGYTNAKDALAAVAADPRGLGFGPVSTGAGIKLLRVSRGKMFPAVEPTVENLRSARYPLSRFLYWAFSAKASLDLVQLSNWVVSSEGQLVVESLGYLPLPASERSGAKQKIAQSVRPTSTP